jgi:hypothetical protein
MAQGRRKLLKVGRGPGFEGHFSNKKWHVKIFLEIEMLATDISHFFLNMKKFFRTYKKILRIYDIFPRNEKNFPEIT